MSTTLPPTIELPLPINAIALDHGKVVAKNRNLLLHLTMIVMYGVLLSSLDGKVAGVSTLKTLLRFASIGCCCFVHVACISRTSLYRLATHYALFVLFGLFAVASITWSPLPSYTMRQVVSLGMMVLFSTTIARLTCNFEHISIVMKHLAIMLFLRTLTMFAAIGVIGFGAINRGSSGQLWHATDVADTACLGLMVILSAAWICKFSWAKKIWLLLSTAFITLSLISQNRLSIAFTPFLVLFMMLFTANRKLIFYGALAILLLIPVTLIVDAHYDLFGSAANAAQSLSERDSSGQSKWSFSGRDQLWAIVWNEYQSVKVRGHGYMVTTSQGEFEVWYEVSNWDAHNMVLHVLVTTGLIGVSIFCLMLFVPGCLVLSRLNQKTDQGRFARSAAMIFCWLFVWGLLNVSFMGYINSSQLVFYAVLGMVIGFLKRETKHKS